MFFIIFVLFVCFPVCVISLFDKPRLGWSHGIPPVASVKSIIATTPSSLS